MFAVVDNDNDDDNDDYNDDRDEDNDCSDDNRSTSILAGMFNRYTRPISTTNYPYRQKHTIHHRRSFAGHCHLCEPICNPDTFISLGDPRVPSLWSN